MPPGRILRQNQTNTQSKQHFASNPPQATFDNTISARIIMLLPAPFGPSTQIVRLTCRRRRSLRFISCCTDKPDQCTGERVSAGHADRGPPECSSTPAIANAKEYPCARARSLVVAASATCSMAYAVARAAFSCRTARPLEMRCCAPLREVPLKPMRALVGSDEWFGRCVGLARVPASARDGEGLGRALLPGGGNTPRVTLSG
jgi:hypothetical protein